MRLRKVVKYIILIIVLVGISSLGKYMYNRMFGLAKEQEITEEPKEVVKDRKTDFNIIEGNYIDEYYDRYMAYKELHSEYSDDEIITYVNIGLDHDFYTEMIDTDMSDGYLILCNKYHTLKSDYVPDLVSLDGYGGGKMEKVAAQYFKEMSDAAKKDGINIRNVSGYRSYNNQKDLYNGYVSRNGQSKADTFSARPGTSEHQTGLATDINDVSDSFVNTSAYKWLINNSYKYGFILRYPKGKEFITGYKFEPWHFRYVGIDVAKIVYEKNITYDEYYATYILKG